MLNKYWIYKHMQRALGTVLRLSIKDNKRSGNCFKWTLTLHHPGLTVARVWMCTALAAGHTDPQLTPSACGIDSFLFRSIHCIYLYLFICVLMGEHLSGPWMLGSTQHPKPTQKKLQELWVSLGHGAVFLRDRVLSGHGNPDMKWQCHQALGVSAEDLWCTKVIV